MALVRLLLDLDQPGSTADVDHAWDEEIRTRVKAVDEGRAVGIPYEQIKKGNGGHRSGASVDRFVEVMRPPRTDRELMIELLERARGRGRAVELTR